MLPPADHLLGLTRRELFRRSGMGLGSIALSTLLGSESVARAGTGSVDLAGPRRPHFAPRAKNVIFLHMVGAPSHLDLFENKPELVRYDGDLVPEHLIAGQRFAFLRGHPKLLGTRFQFQKHGASGVELSELLPHLSGVADELAVIKTLKTEEFNHAPAQLFLQTGFGQFGRPSLGAWVSYGLGSENRDLPSFVVMLTGKVAGAGSSLWGSGFLPTRHQGVEFRNSGDPVLFLNDPPGIDRNGRRHILDAASALNQAQLADVGDPEIDTRTSQYEMAFRMQASVPELMDIRQEPAAIRELYGTTPDQASFASHCLLARRLVERGVRFVQIYNADWDHHGNIFKSLPSKAAEIDQPCAALIRDLKQRGLLDETLVVWTGEFGRTPMLQGHGGKNAGRDHHKEAFCAWIAGGGIKGGTTYGRTDDLGYHSVEDPMPIHDFHATLLHLLGIDHERLTYRFQGREFRLTDVAGDPALKLLS
ncbi:DUF1501 domain-containing protein [soil metagenome]